MEQLLELLCRAGVIPRADQAGLRKELASEGGESSTEQASRVLNQLQQRYALTSEQVATALIHAHIGAAANLPLLTPLIRVLLVEDNPADVELTRRALLRQQRFELVGSVQDGQEALAFLRRQPPFESAKRPDIILLDLDLPRRDGFDVLNELKADPLLESMPVIVLSGTTRDDAAERAYRAHAVSFIHKPSSLSDYRRVANQIETYWSRISALP